MISLRNFSYRFRHSARDALHDVTLDIVSGDFVVITGPSGCGKSTLALAMGGFLFNQYDGHTTGHISVAGMDVQQSPIYDVAEIVGLVQQNPEAQFCTLTVWDEVAFGLENRRLAREEIRARIDWALDLVGATHLRERRLATLSGGEKQRIAIAAMMATRPEVLIFDEPTSNLDPTATAQIFDVIANIRTHANITVIVIEHKTAYLRRFNPRWIQMHDGKIDEAAHQHTHTLPVGTAHTEELFHRQGQTMNAEVRIQVDNLCAGYNGHAVLNNVSLNIGPGEFVALMGDNGSGKTTFLQCLLGLHHPMQGRVMAMGYDTRHIPVSRLAQHVGYVFQNPDHQLFADTVWEEATLAPHNFERWDTDAETRSRMLLTAAHLADRLDDHPYRLSYGEKRRLTLIAVLSYGPPVILLDEVLIGQDPGNAAQLLGWLSAHVAQGGTVLLANHAPGLIQPYATRLLFFQDGQVVVDAPSTDGFATLLAMGYHAYIPEEVN